MKDVGTCEKLQGAGNQAVIDDQSGTTTYTGRLEEDNSMYDVRMVDVTVIASSQDLPRYFDALGKVNYMTVVDVDIEGVDVWDALENGYFYGTDHVVRANIQIETVWLRSWTADLMPDVVKDKLGIATASDDEYDEYDEDDG